MCNIREQKLGRERPTKREAIYFAFTGFVRDTFRLVIAGTGRVAGKFLRARVRAAFCLWPGVYSAKWRKVDRIKRIAAAGRISPACQEYRPALSNERRIAQWNHARGNNRDSGIVSSRGTLQKIRIVSEIQCVNVENNSSTDIAKRDSIEFAMVKREIRLIIAHIWLIDLIGFTGGRCLIWKHPLGD